MALDLISSEELRTACRQKLEACEIWLRRLIHVQFCAEFGDNYIETAQLTTGHAIFNNELRKYVKNRLLATPERYPRPIDALLLEHLASVICKQEVFQKYFEQPFHYGFPIGKEHLQHVLFLLVPIRNALSHANPLAIHDAERVLCY